MQKNSKKFIILHPILIALFPVFLVYSQNIHLILIQGIIFPVLIILGITIALWAGIKFILKNTRKSALLTSLYVFLFFSYGHLSSMLYDLIFKETSYKEHLALLIVFLFILIIVGRFILKTKRSLNKATAITSVIAISLFIFPLVTIGSYYFEHDYAILLLFSK